MGSTKLRQDRERDGAYVPSQVHFTADQRRLPAADRPVGISDAQKQDCHVERHPPQGQSYTCPLTLLPRRPAAHTVPPCLPRWGSVGFNLSMFLNCSTATPCCHQSYIWASHSAPGSRSISACVLPATKNLRTSRSVASCSTLMSMTKTVFFTIWNGFFQARACLSPGLIHKVCPGSCTSLSFLWATS